MSSTMSRIVETTLQVVDLGTGESEATAAVDLNYADKFSIQVVSVSGAIVANLEVSNVQVPSSNADWTEIDDESIADGANHVFTVPDCSYRWARINVANDDAGDVSADCLALVTGDAT